jgi:ubiquitin C-terminal hydrolase
MEEKVAHSYSNISKISHRKRIRFIKKSNFNSKMNSQRIFGIPNLGNTCYLNSMLQIIIRNPFLKEILLSKQLISNDEIIKVLRILIRSVYQNNKHEKNRIPTRKNIENLIYQIYSNLLTLNSNYQTHISYDALVFFRDLINILIEDKTLDTFIKSKIKHIFFGERLNSFFCNNCGKIEEFSETFLDLNLKTHLKDENISNNFKGLISKDNFHSISFLLSQNFLDEILENFYCEKCDKSVDVRIIKQLTKIPLTVAISTSIPYENFHYENQLMIGENSYKLQGMVLYNKLTQHYISKILINQKFYFFNDLIVEENISDESSYTIIMLIYNLL